jgi:alpha-beta hydrolase superfamily lysophospholipase
VTVAFSRTIVAEDIQVEILDGREHEPLNDLGREEVYRLVLDWLANQVDARPDPKQASDDLP